MNFSQPVLSDEHLPHQLGHPSRSSSSSSATAIQQDLPRRQPSVVVTSPAGDMDAQFEQLLSLIGTDRSPLREQDEGKGLDHVGGGDPHRREPLTEATTVNGKLIQGLGVGHPSQPPSSGLSPTRPVLSKPSRLGSYSSVPIPPSTTFAPAGVTPPRPHSVDGERPIETHMIFSSAKTLLPLPIISSPSTSHQLPSFEAPPHHHQQTLRPHIHTHSRNASASSSVSASSSSYRRAAAIKAELTLEHDPFASGPSPVAAVPPAGQARLDDGGSSDEDSSDSDDDQLESLPPSAARRPHPHEHPYHHQYHTHPPSPHPPTPQRKAHQHHQHQPSLPTPTPPNYFAHVPAPQHDRSSAHHHQIPPRRPEQLFQPPHLSPNGPDYNRDERPLVPPAYPQPGTVQPRTTSLTMQIAQSEGWAIDERNDEADTSQERLSGPSSERGDGYNDQRDFLTRPLGLLALSQALGAANDEVAGLRSMVRDVTEIVHAQARDSLSHAQHLHHLQQSQEGRRPDKGRPIDGSASLSGLTDADIDELSGPEARALLKSMRHQYSPPLPPPSQITSSLALIRHIHELTSPTPHDPSSDDRLVFSDANLMRLADVLEGWRQGAR